MSATDIQRELDELQARREELMPDADDAGVLSELVMIDRALATLRRAPRTRKDSFDNE